MKTYAFIFARGGSKGLPGKNIKSLAGKPLLQYSIESATASTLIEKVFVSTDDEEIADVARKNNAIVIDRPHDLASDTSPEWLSWRHAITWVKERYGDFDVFVSLPTTSPLRSVEDVDSAITQLKNKKADICISITSANRSPYFNMVKQIEDGLVGLLIKPEEEVSRRQDAPRAFDITTVVYAAFSTFILNSYGLFSGKATYIEVPKKRAIDIDDIYDFMLAEAILKLNMRSS